MYTNSESIPYYFKYLEYSYLFFCLFFLVFFSQYHLETVRCTHAQTCSGKKAISIYPPPHLFQMGYNYDSAMSSAWKNYLFHVVPEKQSDGCTIDRTVSLTLLLSHISAIACTWPGRRPEPIGRLISVMHRPYTANTFNALIHQEEHKAKSTYQYIFCIKICMLIIALLSDDLTSYHIVTMATIESL